MRRYLLLAAAVSLLLLASCGRSDAPSGAGHHSPGHHGPGGHHHEETARAVKPGLTIEMGQRAPDFTVIDLDGKSWQLSQLHRKAGLEQPGIIVLTFWCSFCGSCRHVERDLDALAHEYSGRVAVFGLDASAGETSEAVSKFLEAQGLTVPILLDPAGTTADIFGTELTTTTVVLDAEGMLRYCGQLTEGHHAYARDAVEDLLAGRQVRLSETPLRG
jgi:peroxiredoxin